MKKFGLLSVLIMSLFVLAACASDNSEVVQRDDIVEDELQAFTLTELAEFDGREGRNAYVAVDGLIYDVTGNSMWPNGLHRGLHQAGQDLSEVINSSPHGKSVLDGLEIIGRLVTEEDSNAS